MRTRRYIMATAGHIDHGKSSLVRALTDTDPDRLPEEKRRGITIELGFADLTTPSPSESEVEFRIGVVDVPGHEDFVKNMVGGVPHVDLALLVVAADDGWMPQTEEHFQILQYLGARRLIIAVTKADLTDDPEFVVEMICEELADTPWVETAIIPVSSTEGTGLETLRGAIASTLNELTPLEDLGKPRLNVDRVFSSPGHGVIVTGALIGGTLRVDQSVLAHPERGETRIRALQSHHEILEIAQPGSRLAVNLAQASIATRKGLGDKGLRRGDVIAAPESGILTDQVDVLLTRSSRLGASQYTRSQPLRHGVRARAHLGSANIFARLTFPKGVSQAMPGDATIARLQLATPVLVQVGDRLILRDASQTSTLAGAVVADPRPQRRGLARPEVVGLLTQRIEHLEDPEALILSRLELESAAKSENVFRETPISRDTFDSLIAKLEKKRKLTRLGDLLFSAKWLQSVFDRLQERIEFEVTNHPERLGVKSAELRALLARAGAPTSAMPAMLERFAKRGFESEGEYWRPVGFQISAAPDIEAESDWIEQTLRQTPFDPTNKQKFHETPTREKALKYLRDAGQVVSIGPDVYLHTETIQMLKAQIRIHIKTNGPATVAAIRDLTGASRKFLIPLLERFDREGFTARQGDERVLGKDAE